MSDVDGRVIGDSTIGLNVGEERFDRINLARDRFSGVVFTGKIFFEGVNVFFSDLGKVIFSGFGDKIGKLFDVLGIGKDGRRSSALRGQVIFEGADRLFDVLIDLFHN